MMQLYIIKKIINLNDQCYLPPLIFSSESPRFLYAHLHTHIDTPNI